MTYTYRPTGVCSTQIDLELEDGIIQSVAFTGGCNGNLKGICALVKGQPAQEIIEKLQGTQCGWKPTSCPDQLRRGRVCAKASFPAKSLREEPRAARMSHQAEVIFSFSRMRSLIMAMNSELVGFPLALLTV